MASISKLQMTKDGRRYWRIQVSRGKGKSPYSTRFFWPMKKKDGQDTNDHVSLNAAEKARDKFAAEFELQCKSGTFLNREEKQQAEQAERQAEEARQIELAKLKTVAQYADDVFMPAKSLELAETTRASYQSFIDLHIKPAIGDILLKDVTPVLIKTVLNDFQLSGKSVRSTQYLYTVMNLIFQMAFMDDSISMNPMLKVPKPRKPKDAVMKEESEKTLDADTLLYVLDCVTKEPLKWQAFMNLAADTGARRGELTGLQWDDIDLDKGTIRIEQNLQYTKDKGVYIAKPKNGKKRLVDIGEDTVAILKAYKKSLQPQEEEEASPVVSIAEYRKKKENKKPLSVWVFPQAGSDSPMHPDSPTRYFKKFGERYGIENFHPHILRHTSASLAITEANADIVSVSARLGHSDTAVTLRMYAHATDESIRKAGQGLRDALKERKRQNAKKAEGQ